MLDRGRPGPEKGQSICVGAPPQRFHALARKESHHVARHSWILSRVRYTLDKEMSQALSNHIG